MKQKGTFVSHASPLSPPERLYHALTFVVGALLVVGPAGIPWFRTLLGPTSTFLDIMLVVWGAAGFVCGLFLLAVAIDSVQTHYSMGSNVCRSHRIHQIVSGLVIVSGVLAILAASGAWILPATISIIFLVAMTAIWVALLFWGGKCTV